MASGFVRTENMVLHPETPLKRAAYVRCLVQLLCRCSYLKDVKPDCFVPIVTALLSDVEAIIGTGVPGRGKFLSEWTFCVVEICGKAMAYWFCQSLSSFRRFSCQLSSFWLAPAQRPWE